MGGTPCSSTNELHQVSGLGFARAGRVPAATATGDVLDVIGQVVHRICEAAVFKINEATSLTVPDDVRGVQIREPKSDKSRGGENVGPS